MSKPNQVPVALTVKRFVQMLRRVGFKGELKPSFESGLPCYKVRYSFHYIHREGFKNIPVMVGNGWVQIDGVFFAVGKRYPREGAYTLKALVLLLQKIRQQQQIVVDRPKETPYL